MMDWVNQMAWVQNLLMVAKDSLGDCEDEELKLKLQFVMRFMEELDSHGIKVINVAVVKAHTDIVTELWEQRSLKESKNV